MTVYDFSLMARFLAVGAAATATFFLFQWLLVGLLQSALVIGTTASFLVSLAVSYLGQHSFTFRKSAGLSFFFSRFAIATAVMIILCNLIMYILVAGYCVNYLVGSCIVAVFYAIGSFLLQSRWVFAASNDN